MHTIRELLGKTGTFFEEKGIGNGRLEAELLLAHVLGTDRVRLFMDLDKPLSEEEVSEYRNIVMERGKGSPVAYLTGSREFYSHSFTVSPAVLIPRPETEHLIDHARKYFPEGLDALLDIGTGSGILAVLLAKFLKARRCVAVDTSPEALVLAEKNAEAHLGEAHGIEFKEGDVYAGVEERFSLIVSNPPYVTDRELEELPRDVAEFEPHAALAGGADGLAVYKAIFVGLDEHLEDGGRLLLEISDSVAAGVAELAERSCLRDWEIHRDFSGHQRVFAGRR